MWTWVFIIFVVALALAPLSHFAPSKRQRAVARMREGAALGGLFVEFRNLPGAPAGRPADGVIYYGKRLPAALADGVRRAAWLRDGESWRPVGSRVSAPEALVNVPAPVLAASVDDASCGVYWREDVPDAEAEQAVEQIRQSLEGWLASLSE